ncbi:MAG: oligosaccharide flippase family protein [Ruminiclostridium sp.]|nr:oligosaccharide flippase family protein [Ruminiclostridium sp.]
MNRYRTLAANTVILGLGQFGSKVLVIVMMRFYQGALGKTGYGEINNIIDTATLLMSLVTLSIGESIIRFGIDKAYDNKQVFSIGMRVTFAGVVCGMLFVPLVGLFTNIFPDNNVLLLLRDYAWLTVLYVTTGSVKSSCALFVRSIGHVKLYAIDGILTTAMNIVFNIFLLFTFNLGNVGYLLSVILADICSIVFLSFTAHLKQYLTFTGLSHDMIQTMLRFCIPMIPTSVMWWIINVSDSFMISGMIGFEASGIYKAASRFPSMISIFSGIFSQAWNMSAITENNSSTIAKFYTNVFDIFQSTVYVIASALMVLIKPLIILFADEQFLEAYIAAPFIVMSVVYTCFSTFMGSVYVASKQSMRSMVTAAIGAVLNIGLNLIMIQLWGIYGATFASFLSFLTIFIVRAADTHRIVNMDLRLPKMAVNVVLLMVMGAVIFMVHDNDLLFYGSLVLLFIVILILNFRAGLRAVRMVLKKEVIE